MVTFAASHAITIVFIAVGGGDFDEFGFVVAAFGADVVVDG